jgi:Lrp/AsnC family transcriptional regulator, leucine-responsive regulatory protein
MLISPKRLKYITAEIILFTNFIILNSVNRYRTSLKKSFIMVNNLPIEISDSTDLQILDHLQRNGRLPVVELSKRVHLSPTPCTLRIRKLEEDGVITGYHAKLNPIALGQALMVFVTVKLRSTDEATLEKFNAAVKPIIPILECHMVGGGFDYLLKIRVRDMAEYREILGGVIGALPMVEGTHSYFVMEDVKDTNLLPITKAWNIKK